MKRCSRCEEEKPSESFHKSKTNKDGLQYVCKACALEYNRLPRIKEYNKRYREEHPCSGRAYIDQLKSRPCMDCGNEFPPYVMDFDHRDPSTKSCTLASMHRAPIEAIKIEAAKCDVVCSNCHRIRTWGRANADSSAQSASEGT